MEECGWRWYENGERIAYMWRDDEGNVYTNVDTDMIAIG
jgi:hypothetical protein